MDEIQAETFKLNNGSVTVGRKEKAITLVLRDDEDKALATVELHPNIAATIAETVNRYVGALPRNIPTDE